MAQKKTATKSKPESQDISTSDRLVNILLRFERFAWDAAGVFLIALSLMTLVALLVPSLSQGALLTGWTDFLRRWFGWGSLMIVAVLGVIGLMLLRRRMGDLPEVRWRRVFALEGAAFTLLPLITFLGGYSLERAEAGLDGGQIGWGLATILDAFLTAIHLDSAFDGIVCYFCDCGFGLGSVLSRIATRILGGEQPPSVEDLVDPAISVAPAENIESLTKPKRTPPKKKAALGPRIPQTIQGRSKRRTSERTLAPRGSSPSLEIAD